MDSLVANSVEWVFARQKYNDLESSVKKLARLDKRFYFDEMASQAESAAMSGNQCMR